MSLSAASPRGFQLYSPRRPSPLGLPPIVSPDIIRSAYPKTPDRYGYGHQQQSEPTPGYGSMRFPPDLQPLGSSSRRPARAPPPAPLNLDVQDHPAAIQLSAIEIEQTLQPHATPEMRVSPSPSFTSTSSLSVYSADSAPKRMSVVREEEEAKKGGGESTRGFCLCFNFSALFGANSNKSKLTKAQPQVISAEPAPAPQMVQTRRRPPSIVRVR